MVNEEFFPAIEMAAGPATLMRRILVQSAREQHTLKRGEGALRRRLGICCAENM